MSRHLLVSVKRQSTWHQIPAAQRRAAIEISTTNLRCTGDYLAEQLIWARGKFTHFQFSIGDTLQIHNYVVLGHPIYDKVDEGQARKIALSEGHDWLKANRDLISQLLEGRSYEFRDWDNLLAVSAVQRNLDEITRLCHSDLELSGAVRKDVAGYLERRGHDARSFSADELAQLDRHVLEELAVYQHQAEDLQLVSIYPGSNQIPLRPQNLRTLNLPRGLKDRHYVTLDIKTIDMAEEAMAASRG